MRNDKRLLSERAWPLKRSRKCTRSSNAAGINPGGYLCPQFCLWGKEKVEKEEGYYVRNAGVIIVCAAGDWFRQLRRRCAIESERTSE